MSLGTFFPSVAHGTVCTHLTKLLAFLPPSCTLLTSTTSLLATKVRLFQELLHTSGPRVTSGLSSSSLLSWLRSRSLLQSTVSTHRTAPFACRAGLAPSATVCLLEPTVSSPSDSVAAGYSDDIIRYTIQWDTDQTFSHGTVKCASCATALNALGGTSVTLSEDLRAVLATGD